MHQNYFNCVSLIILLHIIVQLNGLIPESPCPGIFHYQIIENKWHGIVRIKNPPLLGQTIKLNVNLTVSGLLPKNQKGKLGLFKSRSETIDDIFNGKSILYKVKFPMGTKMPRVSVISFNDDIICTGPKPMTFIITIVELEHILYTEMARITKKLQQIHQVPPTIPTEVIPTAESFFNEKEPSVDYNFDDDDDFLLRYDPNYEIPQSMHRAEPFRIQRLQRVVKSRTVAPMTNQNYRDICGEPVEYHRTVQLAVGGRPTKRGDWPWLVAIYENTESSLLYKCGGSLISNRHILTAAHCVHYDKKRYTDSQIVTFMGRYNIGKWMEPGAIIGETMSIHIHPDYMKTKDKFDDADLAGIILKQPVLFNEYIRPVCLIDNSNEKKIEKVTNGMVIGWGRDDEYLIAAPEPKVVSMPIVSDTKCLRSNNAFKYITSNRTFCAGKRDGTGPCNGDSGSGFFVKIGKKWTLRGIVSTAIHDPVRGCNLNEYIVFTDIGKFSNWVEYFLAVANIEGHGLEGTM